MRTFGRLVAFTAVVLFLTAAGMMAAAPVEAYVVTLTQWNTPELEAAGDTVTVTVSGNIITFTWNDGNGGIDPDATNLLTIAWSDAVNTAGGAATGTGDYSTVTVCGGTGCQEDGFGKYRVEVNDSDPSANKTLTVSFTFANNLDATNFNASDFVLHVQYTNNCSGWVSGENVTGTSSSNCTAGTVVPEPLTVFLGGTGLLAMGYIGRKRLFRRFAS